MAVHTNFDVDPTNSHEQGGERDGGEKDLHILKGVWKTKHRREVDRNRRRDIDASPLSSETKKRQIKKKKPPNAGYMASKPLGAKTLNPQIKNLFPSPPPPPL